MKPSDNPFLQLLGVLPIRKPKSTVISVVVDGKVITDLRRTRIEDPEARAEVKQQLKKARDAERYQRRRNDPDFIAQRKAYDERTREQRQAWKKQYDERTKDQQRELKTAWAKRRYHLEPEKCRQVQRDYYQRNREQILAKLLEKRLAAKAAKAAQTSGE
jgi:hypothetical protein